MQKAIIYHNPRCSKSRQTLALLQEHGLAIEIIEYLKTPPSPAQVKKLLQLLKLSPRELLRTNEAIYKEKHLHQQALSDQVLIATIAEHPILMQRPIVVYNQKAALGRPPENVLEIIK